MHSVIEISGPGEIYIIDLGSASGTIVNGQRVNKARVESGDQLQFGDTVVVVEVGAEMGEQPTPVAAAPEQMYQTPPAGFQAAPGGYQTPPTGMRMPSQAPAQQQAVRAPSRPPMPQ